ncbi:unnamed protein product [Phaeothamnion confervicola]
MRVCRTGCDGDCGGGDDGGADHGGAGEARGDGGATPRRPPHCRAVAGAAAADVAAAKQRHHFEAMTCVRCGRRVAGGAGNRGLTRRSSKTSGAAHRRRE